ncbi:MAG: hypothetical protein JXR31_01325 [Prolixibacteraceae bacterium]|nr:hypothetical protein [Prolixibacteraceae bacterium]
MKTRVKIPILLLILIVIGLLSCTKTIQPEWPEITQETKPWTRWWWMGSAVDSSGITYNMEQLQKAGIGGVEVTAIYGTKGYEDRFIQFLSTEWMEMLGYTLNEANRLELGIDLANASGWPFGGQWIDENNACKNVQHKKYELKEGESLKEPIVFIQEPIARAVGHRIDISEIKEPISANNNLQVLALDQVRFKKQLPIQVVMAYGSQGNIIDLTEKVDSAGNLNWVAPEGSWQIYAVFLGWHGKMVERAGPGGEGNVIDHFSEKTLKKFLNHFDKAADKFDISGIRAFFNDSYEVDDARGEANWTPLFFEEFRQLRGYDLRNYLPALFGNDTDEINIRVRMDYRETISDLLLERFTKPWAKWAQSHNAAIRNQAHDSSGNILDLYAASGIPETEGTDPLGIKFASSAAHVTGKKLVSSETATWLGEHFTANLADLKQNIDRYFANGVNHIVYHGTPYSPEDAKWPGWMFYASTHLAPTNPLWDDFSAINEYVARCQSFLQNSKPANDILVYFPMYDFWAEEGRESLRHFEENARETPVKKIGDFLLENDYSFDFISEKQIEKLETNGDNIISSGNKYKTILIPECKYISLKVIEQLLSLAENGITIIFQNKLPETIPGLFDYENRKQFYEEWKKSIILNENEFRYGKGRFLVGDNLNELLAEVQISGEEFTKYGLWFTTMSRKEGRCYLISNWSKDKYEGWLNFNTVGKDAVLFDPANGRKGKAVIKNLSDKKTAVYFQLEKGETLILQFYNKSVKEEVFPFWEETGDSLKIDGDWEISFLKGGPALPEKMNLTELKPWSEIPGLEEFSGTASYKCSFKIPEISAKAFRLNLGEVYETAKVFLNGNEVAVLTGPVYYVDIPSESLEKENQLEVRISNLMANRIIGMEKRGEKYQDFYNINFSAKYRENLNKNGVFTTLGWNPLKSGLVGPVVLKPLINTNIQ